jgi:hypothetical protein
MFRNLLDRLHFLFMSKKDCIKLADRIDLVNEVLEAVSNLKSFAIKIDGNQVVYVPAMHLPTLRDYDMEEVNDGGR